MTDRQIRLLFVRIAIGAMAAGAIIAAPHAKADQYSFLNMLDSNGVAYHDAPGMISDGKLICGELRGHQDVGQIVAQAEHEGGFSGTEAAMVIMAAADEMCPDTIPYLQAQANAAQGPKLNYAT